MYKSLLALSVGDAAGENTMKILPQSAYKAGNVAGERGIMDDVGGYWPWTDDTAMAIGVYRTLCRFGTINQIELAKEFARNAKLDPQRGYGKGTARLLFNYLYDVDNWRDLSEHAWGFTPMSGSKGNGSAMRDSIIGPFFERDFHRIAVEARLSAEVTHYNQDAIDGSIAVALAASIATYDRAPEKTYWYYLNLYVPVGAIKNRILAVAEMEDRTNWEVITTVGNGKEVTAIDTVPFALWQAHQGLAKKMDFQEIINSIVEVGGDTDTVAAMVGGIIGNRIKIPQAMIDQTETLPDDIKP